MSSDAPVPDDPPKSLFEKIGAALPIALTAIATAFAGMSSSEMSSAMYWRSAAAQDQAKVNDQWSLAGFKRDRSLIVQAAAAQLRAAAGYRPLVELSPGDGEQKLAAEWLQGRGPPAVKLPEMSNPEIAEVMKAIRERQGEAEVLRHARKVSRQRLDETIVVAEGEMARVEREWDPVLKQLDAMVQQSLDKVATADDINRPKYTIEANTVQVARFEVDYRRYRAEATLNQGIGYLYEVRVKTATVASDRHRSRSQNFFYAMLAAQIGATVSALGLARRQRSALWLVAGLAGVVSVSFGVYVYLGM